MAREGDRTGSAQSQRLADIADYHTRQAQRQEAQDKEWEGKTGCGEPPPQKSSS